MKVLFATTNASKVGTYKEKLEKNGIEVLSLKDLNLKLDIDENGKNAIENAYIKAKAYYDETKMITIGMDDNLYIDNIPEEKQPGTHVRRVNGKELTDDEMIEHYTNLAKEYGGRLTAKWVYGMVIYDGKNVKEYTWSKDAFYFVDKPCEERNIGYPLDSIAVLPKFNKYLSELTKEEKDEYDKQYGNDEVVKFIVKSLNK